MRTTKDEVILVDEQDEQLGTTDKLTAHTEGLLHRAFSIFVLNGNNELLLQQRALHKYHSGGLWSNTCCSHPMPGENTLSAAHRRLQEEMGFDCELQQLFQLRYKEEVGNDMIENEYDHVFIGRYNEHVIINPDEVAAYQYISLSALETDILAHPEHYTIWLRLALSQFLQQLSQKALGKNHGS